MITCQRVIIEKTQPTSRVVNRALNRFSAKGIDFVVIYQVTLSLLAQEERILLATPRELESRLSTVTG